MNKPKMSSSWIVMQGRLATTIGHGRVEELHAYLPPEGEPSFEDIDHALEMAGYKTTSQPRPRRRRSKTAH
jgi:hypothetical protein